MEISIKWSLNYFDEYLSISCIMFYFFLFGDGGEIS